MFLIEGVFGILGFFGNFVIIAVLYVLISGLFGNVIYNAYISLMIKYTKLRTGYFKLKLKKDPRNSKLYDKYRRSSHHVDLLVMNDFLEYLSVTYGGYNICPGCKFPHKPETYSCPYCNYVKDETFVKVMKFIREGI